MMTLRHCFLRMEAILEEVSPYIFPYFLCSFHKHGLAIVREKNKSRRLFGLSMKLTAFGAFSSPSMINL